MFWLHESSHYGSSHGQGITSSLHLLKAPVSFYFSLGMSYQIIFNLELDSL